mgnify:CR=1 FL=1
MKTLGKHLLAELTHCQADLDDVSFIKEHMEKAAIVANATIVQSVFHHYSPYGVSGVVVIAESHLAIHTWPEYGYAAVDVFTCGENVDTWGALNFLTKAFKAELMEVKDVSRGQLSKIMTHKTRELAIVEN